MSVGRRLLVRLMLGTAILALHDLVAIGQTAPPSSTLRIYLARHGESEGNLAGIATGWTDVRLTARGREQARELAEVLRGTRLDGVYASTLARSRDTAEIVSSGGVRALDGLRERHWGRFAGRPASDPEFIRRRAAEGDTMDGGESPDMFYERVRATVDEIRRQHSSGAILIVGHGATNQQIIRSLLTLTPAQAATIVQANDEVYAIELVAGRPPLLWKLIRPRTLGEL
jgi:broad specificity phosphatase PhoE